MRSPAWVQLATDRRILRRALLTSLVVGLLLTGINHGEELLRRGFDTSHTWPIVLTLLVPFTVTLISSISAVRGLTTGESANDRERGVPEPVPDAGPQRDGSGVVVLAPDVAERFPDSESVNRALRSLGNIQRGARNPLGR
jgi:hypothetical protein